jgi:hypothetical protein
MDVDLRDLKNSIIMVSPMEHCMTPPPEEHTPIEVSPLDTQSILERQPSTFSVVSPDSQEQKSPTSPKKRKKISRRNTAPTVPRLNTSHARRPSLSLDLIFTPRPLEVILAERAYLISSHHRQNMQSRQFIREYSVLEKEFFSPVTHGKARRRLRKKLGHLRAQLEQAAGQEKFIFNRIGEVYTELSSHAAWSEAALWRIPLQQQHQQVGHSDASSEGYFAGYGSPLSRETSSSSQNALLDPTSPVFVPGRPIYASSDSSSAIKFTSDLSNSSALETVDETSEDCSSDHESYEELDEEDPHNSECGESTENSPLRERRTSCDEALMSPREKRLSLPCLGSVWPEA